MAPPGHKNENREARIQDEKAVFTNDTRFRAASL
jgi:hypothetical protein